MPLYLADDLEIVLHVLWILVWDDLVKRGHPRSETEGSRSFVEDLTILASHDRIADALFGQH